MILFALSFTGEKQQRNKSIHFSFKTNKQIKSVILPRSQLGKGPGICCWALGLVGTVYSRRGFCKKQQCRDVREWLFLGDEGK